MKKSEFIEIINKLLTRITIAIIAIQILSCMFIYNSMSERNVELLPEDDYVAEDTNWYNHQIDLGAIRRFNHEYSGYCYDQLVNGDKHIEYHTEEERKLIFAALNDILLYYYDYSTCSEEHENCIEIIEHGRLITLNDIGYKAVIQDALNSMDLNCDDVTMIEQINRWICDNLEYEITNGDVYELFSTYEYKGQCFHYAQLFKDMCNAVGINMKISDGWISEGYGHSWNYCEIDNVIYYFDATWNDFVNSYGTYMFMTEEEFQEFYGEFEDLNYDLY